MSQSYMAMLRAVCAPGRASETARLSFYREMKGGYAWKFTYSGRLAKFDRILVDEIAARWPGRHVLVHDMAVSSAITSLELYRLIVARQEVTMRASDHYDALIVSRPFPVCRVVFDADLAPLQFVCPLGKMRFRRGGNKSRDLLAKFILPSARKAIEKGRFERISMFHPDAVAAASASFQLVRDNIFNPSPGRYDVVRIMNTLSEANFARSQIAEAIRSVAPTVAEGGLLVIGSNEHVIGTGDIEEDGRTDSTIFLREAAGFTTLIETGGGYPMKDLVIGRV